MKKQASTTHFFYQNGKLVTVNQGGQQRAIFRTADMPLAEQQSDGSNGLLATDRSNSVLAVQDEEEEPDHRFTAYGHDPTLQSTNALLGFNGEAFEPATTCYQLGNGYRTYSPLLMRFCSPDSWSPFGNVGFNSYDYCEGDPINSADPSGHMRRNLFNSQIVKVNKNMAVSIGRWREHSPITRSTSVDSFTNVVQRELPSPPLRKGTSVESVVRAPLPMSQSQPSGDSSGARSSPPSSIQSEKSLLNQQVQMATDVRKTSSTAQTTTQIELGAIARRNAGLTG